MEKEERKKENAVNWLRSSSTTIFCLSTGWLWHQQDLEWKTAASENLVACVAKEKIYVKRHQAIATEGREGSNALVLWAKALGGEKGAGVTRVGVWGAALRIVKRFLLIT